MLDQRSNTRGSGTKNVFGDEQEALKASKEFLENEQLSLSECKEHIVFFQKSYDELLDQAKLITKVSDRLQNKINKANEELEFKNIALQESLDALTKAKLSKKAIRITLIVVFALFLITEAFVEPRIDEFAHNYFKNGGLGEITLSLLAKTILFLSLRPIETVVEMHLIKKEQEKFRNKGKEERKKEMKS